MSWKSAGILRGNFEASAMMSVVDRVRVVVSAEKIYGGDAKFRSDKGNVGEGTLSSFEAFAGNVSLEVSIGITIINGVVFIWQFVLLVNCAESFSSDAANALRTYQNISVIGSANIADGFIVNCV